MLGDRLGGIPGGEHAQHRGLVAGNEDGGRPGHSLAAEAGDGARHCRRELLYAYELRLHEVYRVGGHILRVLDGQLRRLVRREHD